MIQWKRTRSVLSTLSIIVVFLVHQPGAGMAQAEKFRESLLKGDTALNQRNFEAAVNAYKNSIREARALTGAAFATATAQANLGLSRAYLGLGAFKNAIQSCDEALKHTGSSSVLESMVRNQRGLSIVASVSKPGDPKLEDAIAEFRKVLAITDQDPIVSYNLGVTLLKLNRDAEGIHELQTFVARVGRTTESDAARRFISEPRRARENFAPDFSVTTVDGEFVTLQDLRGKVVLLDFWGTWCPPCRDSTPSLVRYSKKHSSELFVMVGVAVNEQSEQGWRDYIEKHKMTWPQYLDSTRKIASLFKVTGFPTYITIDADGVIRDRRTGWNSETMNSIDDHVKKAVKVRRTSGPPSPLDTPALTAPPPAVNSPVAVGTSTVPAQPSPGDAIPPAGVSVRGRATRLPGASATLRATLILPGTPGTPAVTTSAVVGPDGLFEFFNVRPGNYNLTLSVPVPFQRIVVGGADVSGIEFTVPATKTVSGKVTMEGGGAIPQRLAFLVGYPNGSVGLSALVQPDGSFNVLLPEGEHRLGLNVAGYSARSIAYGSSDLLRDPLRLSSTDTAQLLVTLLASSTGVGAPPFPGAVPLPPPGAGRGLGPGTGGGGGRGVQNAAGTNPVLLQKVDPQYTDQARQARLQGAVTLRGNVRRDGSVDSIQVLQGLGLGLDEAAVAALRQWRFQPATLNGQPVELTLTFTINFALN